VLEVDKGVGRPQTLTQLLARDELSGTRQKRNQDLERFTLQFQRATIAAQFSGAQIGLEFSKPYNRRRKARGLWQHQFRFVLSNRPEIPA
jgi:hypothetical protein